MKIKFRHIAIFEKRGTVRASVRMFPSSFTRFEKYGYLLLKSSQKLAKKGERGALRARLIGIFH
ncbi:MAG: hypothetical protein GTN53_42265 [Candidatus Aminicenantes bacterium]|nr:hypothetical protein [Candidatus Aminicenantes bacterium]NIT29142.1 hypothetical protein [Candidatus Aminicenantes bacterium]